MLPPNVLLAALLTVPVAIAQQRTPGPAAPQDPVAPIAAMLRSDDAREQAWGAYYAGRDRLRQLAPELQQVITQRLDDPTQAGSAAVAISLDALIQLKVSAVEMLPAVYERWPVEALVLASLGNVEDQDGFLVSVLQSAKSEEWFSAANLLLQRKSRALPPPLLQELRVALKVYLAESEILSGGGGLGIAIGCGAIGQAQGLPPWPAYDLSTFGHAGLTILALGPVPVYYRRLVSAAGQTPAFCDSSMAGPTSDERIRYLAALADIPVENVPIRGYESRTIVAKAGTSVPATSIETLRADVAARYSRFLRMLTSAGVLTAEAASSYKAAIDVEVEDRRGR